MYTKVIIIHYLKSRHRVATAGGNIGSYHMLEGQAAGDELPLHTTQEIVIVSPAVK